ncbi:MAG: NAD-dependent epimerase/dehydratase family protein [Clostridiales bacterium]|nr:NAD-dependent epimerase/dehydratase family protein [Clostridiales bacterium]
MFVVTGATGYVGGVLVRTLLAKGEDVRVVVPPFEDGKLLEGLDVEVSIADVTQYESIQKTIKEDDIVLHVAGMISILPGSAEKLNRVNVTGTSNVVKACLENKAKRLVYVSSVHAFPEFDGEVNEGTVIDPYLAYGNYGRSKARATLQVFNGIKEGLDAIVVHPSGVFGPFDHTGKNSLTRAMQKYITGKQKALIRGGYDFVDVRDIAKGIYLAAIKGKKGRNYILSGNFITIEKLVIELGKITGKKTPKFNCPKSLALFIAPFAEFFARISRFAPMITRYSLHTLWTKTRFNNNRAKRELGWTTRDVKTSLKDTVKWMAGQKVEYT